MGGVDLGEGGDVERETAIGEDDAEHFRMRLLSRPTIEVRFGLGPMVEDMKREFVEEEKILRVWRVQKYPVENGNLTKQKIRFSC